MSKWERIAAQRGVRMDELKARVEELEEQLEALRGQEDAITRAYQSRDDWKDEAARLREQLEAARKMEQQLHEEIDELAISLMDESDVVVSQANGYRDVLRVVGGRIRELQEQLEIVRRWHDIWKELAEKREETLWAIANEGVYWNGTDWTGVPNEMAKAALASNPSPPLCRCDGESCAIQFASPEERELVESLYRCRRVSSPAEKP